MAIRLVGRKHWSADRKKKKKVPSVGMAVQFYKELQVGCLCLADKRIIQIDRWKYNIT